MARTSKKKKRLFEKAADQQPEKMYSAGIYARLSVDKAGRESESIETQVEIAKEFISSRKDMKLYDIYTDIGETGTDFARKGFERMMQDVRMRKVDCIVVKDLSRFGRDHIETGNYLEKIFPFMGVRFVAVTDKFDSGSLSGKESGLDMRLKNLVNEMYVKDIALKVETGRKAKWENGSYTGGVAPYGYRGEWAGDKKCLFPEEKTSEIVKKIYGLFLSGKNMREIVLWLYEHQVVRPAQYHKTGEVYCREKDLLEQWPRGSVRMILTNPVYMGCLVQGRTCGKAYKMRDRHHIDACDWQVKEHTHEAIISEDMFFEAARKFERLSGYCNKNGFSRTVPSEQDLFAEILYCGSCGAKMKRHGAVKTFGSKDKIRVYSYHCPNSDRIDAFKCMGKNISLCALTNIVKKAIGQEFSLSAMGKKEIMELHRHESELLEEAWKKQQIHLEKKIEGIIKLQSEQYMQFQMGEVEEERFKKTKEETDGRKVFLQNQKKEMIEKLRMTKGQTARENQFLSSLMEGTGGEKLTAEVIHTFISRIEVHPDHRIKIIFCFKRDCVPHTNQ